MNFLTLPLGQKMIAFWESLFPNREISSRKIPWHQQILLAAVLTAIFSLIGRILPANGGFAWDWIHFWSIQRVPPFYPPWVSIAIQPLTWPLLIGLTLAAVSLAALRRQRNLFSMAAVFLSLPVFWVIFLGQLEGLILLGLLGLPWLAPLALLKPQVSFFAFGARKSYLAALLVVLLISILIWGFWPARMLGTESYYAEGRPPQSVGLGLWGLPLFLATIWFSRGDMDMLMASGVFITPHLVQYNLLPLVPAIARLRPRSAFIASALSWLSFSANWLGPAGWWLGWFFVLWLWVNLASGWYPHWKVSRWLVKLG